MHPQDDTIAARIYDRWQAAAETTCLTLLGAEGATSYTGRDLCGLVGRYAAGLAERGVGRGDRVGVVLPTSETFVGAFFGALWLGAAVVPLAPPMFRQAPGHEADRLSRALNTAGARLAVAPAGVGELLADWPGVCVDPADLAAGAPLAGPREAGDLALIQFSSGSTGHPKGVALTNGQILANLTTLRAHLGVEPDDVLVSWLPLFHDMGLTSSLLWTQIFGVPAVIMPPEAFILDPVFWLDAFTHYRGTMAAAPNFAYQLCARLPDFRLQGVDLASWRVAMVGAEPIRPATLEAFIRKLAPYGFRPGTLMPSYGLAEAVVGVTARPTGSGMIVDRIEAGTYREKAMAVPTADEEVEALTMVSVGPAFGGISIEIRDDNGERLPERHVGEICVQSPGVMVGYYDNPEATAAALTPDAFLRTGDLGYLVGDQLYISGRIKDLIIRGGAKYHPQDLEAIAETHEAIRPSGTSAFVATTDQAGRERVVVLAELKKGLPPEPGLPQALQRQIHEATGLRVDEIVLLKPYQLPKTTSGKIRRSEARRRFLAGELLAADV